MKHTEKPVEILGFFLKNGRAWMLKDIRNKIYRIEITNYTFDNILFKTNDYHNESVQGMSV